MEGINGQVAMSALGSRGAYPTAFIAHVLIGASSTLTVSAVFQPSPALSGWGCGRQVSTGLGMHAGQRSLRHQVLVKLAPIWPFRIRRSCGP